MNRYRSFRIALALLLAVTFCGVAPSQDAAAHNTVAYSCVGGYPYGYGMIQYTWHVTYSGGSGYYHQKTSWRQMNWSEYQSYCRWS